MRDRYDNIDAFRLVFAFCVLLLHVPMFGKPLFEPLFRNAVPFFYVVSGYFIYRNYDLQDKLFSTSKKWMLLFIKYFIIITSLSIGLHLYLGQDYSFHITDLFQIINGGGKCDTLDRIVIHNQVCGLYVLWFLLSGCYTFFIFALFSRFLDNVWIYLVILIVFICSILCYAVGVQAPRIFLYSIPYIGLGILIKQHEKDIKRYARLRNIIIAFMALIVEYAIWLYSGKKIEGFFMSPIFITLLFVYLLSNNTNSNYVAVIAEWGRKFSLDIYIYHRFIYAVILLLIGTTINILAAPLVFCVALLISCLIKLLCRQIQSNRKQ